MAPIRPIHHQRVFTPPSILGDTLSGAITSESLEVNGDPNSNSSIGSSPGNQSNLFERHTRSRFTLNRIFLGVIPFSFVVSKFIDNYLNDSPFKLNLLDFVPALLMFILYWCSLYEDDPPPSLQWLLDTDWDYVFYISKRDDEKTIR
ncbi:hypothetical protein JVU11DRAFT_3100 [Chiua virens]|nr:hypothetical protein JVU11DRAFT_3100 [Chiua virens]